MTYKTFFMARFSVYKVILCFVFLTVIAACSNQNRGARGYLAEAETAYQIGNFELAKLKIDSIRMLFPRAFDEINAGFALMQRVRMAENRRNIAFADSMLYEKNIVLAEMLPLFDFVRDDEFQDIGEFYPRIYPHHASLNRSGLRSGVNERGAFFVESVLVSNPIRHSKIRVALRDGSFAETLPVTSEGFNHRFSTLENSYEIVRFRGDAENGVAKFIETFQDEPITVQFIGNRTVTATLSNAEKRGIAQSLELSILLTDIERLKFERDRSEMLIRYLESRE
jgi:hypothetical protein